ncbi:hypothetical protein [Leptolyngbya sp. FACHB-17]|uniref:hypothetical protein n=1 Tax=unclassified Leptolyngbya TaxID=2650499 RepID=UPI001681AE3B|nr:hypothetical protein [Leptolyngbya sp. FACHB-17]MBD2078435.1 hypothetical protein [Leptolyngbya sp. FACHB-17]
MSIFSRIFFGNESDDTESFTDTNSEIQYMNHSKKETLDHAARFEEYDGGSDLRTKDGRDPSEVSDSAKFNTAIFEVDEQGFYFPSELDPGNPRNPGNRP